MDLSHLQIAVLAENQFQELELWYPVLRLRETGANVLIVGPTDDQVYGSKLGYPVIADVAIADVGADDFDAVIIPGGFAPEGMRRHKAMIDFVRAMHDKGKLVAAICHAGWVLASAGVAKGRTLTCVALIRDDVVHAGANYVDQPVVRDGNLITSRLPGDLPDFMKAIVDYLATVKAPPRSSRKLEPSRGRPASTADYREAVHVAMGPRGKASANYTTAAVPVQGGR